MRLCETCAREGTLNFDSMTQQLESWVMVVTCQVQYHKLRRRLLVSAEGQKYLSGSGCCGPIVLIVSNTHDAVNLTRSVGSAL